MWTCIFRDKLLSVVASRGHELECAAIPKMLKETGHMLQMARGRWGNTEELNLFIQSAQDAAIVRLLSSRFMFLSFCLYFKAISSMSMFLHPSPFTVHLHSISCLHVTHIGSVPNLAPIPSSIVWAAHVLFAKCLRRLMRRTSQQCK